MNPYIVLAGAALVGAIAMRFFKTSKNEGGDSESKPDDNGGGGGDSAASEPDSGTAKDSGTGVTGAVHVHVHSSGEVTTDESNATNKRGRRASDNHGGKSNGARKPDKVKPDAESGSAGDGSGDSGNSDTTSDATAS